MIRIVGIGGGTGLPVLLRGLSNGGRGPETQSATDVAVSAIVCVSDNGGSTGWLRQAFGIPAVGDLRNCLVGLSHEDAFLAELLQYRFSEGEGLKGHTLGNLILTALYQRSGSLRQAVQSLADLLQLKGRILPATEARVVLCSRATDGTTLRGESEITLSRKTVERVWLEPANAPGTSEVFDAIAQADVIVLGPGSLYTSIVSNLLVSGIAAAVRRSAAKKIFVCNLVTQPGETDGFTAAEHLRVLEAHLGGGVVDFCLTNTGGIAAAARERYRQIGAEPVHCDPRAIARLGAIPVGADVVSAIDGEVRHDPKKLARLIFSLSRKRQDVSSYGARTHALPA